MPSTIFAAGPGTMSGPPTFFTQHYVGAVWTPGHKGPSPFWRLSTAQFRQPKPRAHQRARPAACAPPSPARIDPSGNIITQPPRGNIGAAYHVPLICKALSVRETCGMNGRLGQASSDSRCVDVAQARDRFPSPFEARPSDCSPATQSTIQPVPWLRQQSYRPSEEDIAQAAG